MIGNDNNRREIEMWQNEWMGWKYKSESAKCYYEKRKQHFLFQWEALKNKDCKNLSDKTSDIGKMLS